jgi:hypothetical protein
MGDGWIPGLVLGSMFVVLLDAALSAWRRWRQYGYRKNHTCSNCSGEVRANGRGYGALEYLDICGLCGDTSVRKEER